VSTVRSPGVGWGEAPTPCLHNPDPNEIAAHLERGEFFWLDLEGPTDAQLHMLAKHVGLHPLTVEDARTFDQRPKLEDYEGYIFLVVYGVDPATSSGGPLLREVHLIISGDFITTVHRRPLKALDEVRAIYNRHAVRSEQFLIYKILDSVTQTFFPVLTRIDDDIDDIEQELIEQPTEEILRRIFSIKRDLVSMRRVVAPERDVFARGAERIGDLRGLTSDAHFYFRDLYDALVRVGELVDSYRDLLSGATDMYLSTVANRHGEINKQLTIIATIFLPLTFITGFFGQNFAFMTDHITNTTWSFLVFGLGLLLVSTIGFLIYFRRKKWM
jgi:magnesium transporter